VAPLDLAVASVYWEAIWSDSAKGLISVAVRQKLAELENIVGERGRQPIILSGDPDKQGQLDTKHFLPIYFPLGLFDATEDDERFAGSPLRRLNYYSSQLRKLEDYPGRLIVALGAETSSDLHPLIDAVSSFAPAGLRLVIIWPNERDPLQLPDSKHVPIEVWLGDIPTFLQELEKQQVPTIGFVARTKVRLGNTSLVLSDTDLSPLLDHFVLVCEQDVVSPDPSTIDRSVLENMLKGDEDDWRAYAAGLVSGHVNSPLRP
jgi:hypothetical protein